MSRSSRQIQSSSPAAVRTHVDHSSVSVSTARKPYQPMALTAVDFPVPDIPVISTRFIAARHLAARFT